MANFGMVEVESSMMGLKPRWIYDVDMWGAPIWIGRVNMKVDGYDYQAMKTYKDWRNESNRWDGHADTLQEAVQRIREIEG